MPQTEACCLSDSECQELIPSECLELGGLPYGPGSVCNPGGAVTQWPAIGCRNEACCHEDHGGWCQDTTYADCLERGGRPLGRGTVCHYFGGDDACPPTGVFGAKCCLRDGSFLPPDTIPNHYCEMIPGAVAVDPTDPCEPPPEFDPDCAFPADDRDVGDRWTLELCATAALGVAIFRGQASVGRRSGTGALLSLRRVRNTWESVCRYAAGDLVLDPRKYGEAVFCSDQERSRDAIYSNNRASSGAIAIQREATEPVTRPGYGVFATTYEAPDWTEAKVYSELVRCGAGLE